MRFSVIIPLYNNEKYIEQCIESVLQQDYHNYEVIIINDDSTDNSLELCNKYKSDKIKIYSIKNHGLSYARNLGVSKASGDYILFLDSDDYYNCNFLTDLNEQIKNNDYDLIITKCNILNNVKLRRFLYDCEFNKELINNSDKITILKHLIETKMINVVWRYVINRNVLIRNELSFNEKLKKFEDEEWTVKLLSFCEKFYFYDKQYYTYRIREESIMTKRNISDLKYYLKVINNLLEFSNDKRIVKYRNYVLTNCKRLLKYVMRQVTKELGEIRHKNKKIILVGLGKAGYLHYKSYLKIESIKREDIILVDTSEGKEYFKNMDHFYDVTSAMKYHDLNPNDVILDICTPKDCFKNIADEGQQLGIKNMIIEKPCMIELKEYSDINIMMIQNYMYSKITQKLKNFITICEGNIKEINTNFSKNRIEDSKKFRGGTNGKNVTIFEVEMPHQIYIVDYLLNKKEMGVNEEIKVKDFFPGDSHAYGLIKEKYKNITISHLSDLCNESTIKNICIKFNNGIVINANYLHYDENLNKTRNGVIDIYYQKSKIFSELFEEDDNMYENIKYIYNQFNSNNKISNKEAILLNSIQIKHYKNLINQVIIK